ncbi:NUDIX hydrolase [Micromonospora chalcea]|uniref:NUDIX hydrolase n=1 Tax=Micromonospora chalcea TaxID=1874 RepID=UPI001656F133|nr:NUDIX hydrolase [Micromonospora chalcea]MBC8988743.1 NUDIX hydrolase [Micromonospora chalcea]
MTWANDSPERLARVLESVPGDGESSASARGLCIAAGFDPTGATATAEAVVGLLRLSGAIETTEKTATGDLHIKANSPVAALFLRSLAAYLRSGTPVIDHWTRAGTVEPPYLPNQVLVGSQLLYLLEARRLALDSEAPPLREGRIVQILINTRLRLAGRRYLMIYDRAARQYQLPGGHQRPDDSSPLATAVRELEEEIPEFAFNPRRDRLTELGEVEVIQQSRTYGAVTRYRMTFFQLTSTRQSLKVGPEGHWVGRHALLDGQALVKGRTVNAAGVRRLIASLPGGLDHLAVGLSLGRRRSFTLLLREKAWEVIGVVLGIAGLVVTLVQLVAESGSR